MQITRLSSIYIENPYIYLYIPDIEGIKHTLYVLENEFNNAYVHADRFCKLSNKTVENIEIYSELITQDIPSQINSNRCIKITGRLLDIYLMFENSLINSIIDGAINNFYIDYFKNLPMTDKEYNSLIRFKKCISDKDKIYCPLSMEKTKKNQIIAITPCNHLFASNNLKNWLTKKCTTPVCPVCRHYIYNTIT